MPLTAHLLENRFSNIVVGPPVSRALGVGELIHEVAAGLEGQTHGIFMDSRRVIHQMALTTVEIDRANFVRRGQSRQRDERPAGCFQGGTASELPRFRSFRRQ